jgi:hypothetical protein
VGIDIEQRLGGQAHRPSQNRQIHVHGGADAGAGSGEMSGVNAKRNGGAVMGYLLVIIAGHGQDEGLGKAAQLRMTSAVLNSPSLPSLDFPGPQARNCFYPLSDYV